MLLYSIVGTAALQREKIKFVKRKKGEKKKKRQRDPNERSIDL